MILLLALFGLSALVLLAAGLSRKDRKKMLDFVKAHRGQIARRPLESPLLETAQPADPVLGIVLYKVTRKGLGFLSALLFLLFAGALYLSKMQGTSVFLLIYVVLTGTAFVLAGNPYKELVFYGRGFTAGNKAYAYNTLDYMSFGSLPLKARLYYIRLVLVNGQVIKVPADRGEKEAYKALAAHAGVPFWEHPDL